MECVQACRICLNANIRLYKLSDSDFKKIYEVISSSLLNTDGKPLSACYICYARLKQSLKLRQLAIKSNQILDHIFNSGVVASQTYFKLLERGAQNTLQHFQISSTYHLHLEPDKSDLEHDTLISRTVKKENAEADIKDVAGDPEISETADFDNSIKDFQSDSEDDLPLTAFSLKGKVEKPIRIRRYKEHKDKDKKDFKVDAKEIELTEEQQKQELLKRASSNNYLNSPYKCEMCYKGFAHPTAYTNHLEKHDKRSGPHECPVCRLRYGSSRQLRAHAAAAHARRYACTRCPHRAHTKHQARDHEKWHDGHTYPCRICGQKFHKPTSYLTHMRKRHSEHVCVRCGDSFVGRHGLLMHLSKSHKRDEQEPDNTEGPESERFCTECNIQFLTLNAWKRHILTSFKHTHKNENSPQCDICGERVSSHSRASHMRAHARALRPRLEVPEPAAQSTIIDCQQCGAQFITRPRLQAHIKRVHLGLKYNKHVVCEVCGKNFTSVAALRYHQRRHTGERPYSCALCTSRFADSNQLRIHSRTHTGERPYACPACHKRFSQKPALNRHFRVHSGVKPYECQYCAKSFSQSNSLKLHVRTVHLKMPPNKKGSKIQNNVSSPNKDRALALAS